MIFEGTPLEDVTFALGMLGLRKIVDNVRFSYMGHCMKIMVLDD